MAVMSLKTILKTVLNSPYESVQAWEGPSGGYGYERGCSGRVLFLDMLLYIWLQCH